MFKFLFFLLLGGFAAFRFINYIFKMLGAGARMFDEVEKFYRSGAEKNSRIQIDRVSEDEKKRRQQSQKFKGGDYIDYEETK